MLELCNSTSIELHNVYLVRRKVFFEDKILKWNISSTVWIERLVKPSYVSYFGYVHEKLNYKGSHGLLKEYIIHYQFSKGINNWIQRRKKYAQLEFFNKTDLKKIQLISNNKIAKRIKIRDFFINHVPFYYIIYFAYNFFIKLAFLDGLKGIKYIMLETYSLYLLSKFKKNAKQS